VWVLSSLSLDNFNLSANRRPVNTEYVHLPHLPPVQSPQHRRKMFIVKIWFMRREDSCHLCPILRILSGNKKTFCVYLVYIRRLSAYTKYKKEDSERA